MRAWPIAVAAVLLAAGCGSAGSVSSQGEGSSGGADAANGKTLAALLREAGEDVGLTPGTSDYVPGRVRFSFLVIDRRGAPIYRRRARFFIGTGLKAKPFVQTTATLEPVGVPGASRGDPADITNLYVAHFRVPRAGKYWVLAQPIGGKPIQGVYIIDVKPHGVSPAVGSKAFPSRTPTLASAHGDLAKLTTRVPPDRPLLRYSVAESLAEHRPFVLVFATPKFCMSRTCGPVVDVVDKVRQQFSGSGIRFIHVEIYKNNNPALGFNRWVREWHLPTEPWVFLVGGDGRIRAKFEGSISVAELAAAVERDLG